MKKALCLLVLISTCFLLFAQNETKKPQAGAYTIVPKVYTDSLINGYSLYLPRAYYKNKQSYPLLIALHGGSAVGGKISKVNYYGIPKHITFLKELSNEVKPYLLDSFIIVAPHMSEGNFEERQFYLAPEAFKEILIDMKSDFRVDSSRIYLSGLSRGGHGTWGLTSLIGEEFTAVAPVAGAIHGVKDFNKLANIPIWVAHNIEDHLVGYDEAEEAVKNIETLSGETFLQINTVEAHQFDYLNHTRIFSTFDRDHHDAWTGFYDRVELYKWLLKQRKTKASKVGLEVKEP